MYYPALIVFVITLIPLFFTKYLFVEDWERPKDLNGIDAAKAFFYQHGLGLIGYDLDWFVSKNVRKKAHQ